MKTQAAVLSELGQPLRLEELSLPALQPGQVLVHMAFSGVCHSQILEVQGKRGPDRFLPHTLGHEGSGTVLEVGPGVQKIKPGNRVVLSWIKGTGADIPSVVYPSPKGPIHSGAISTFMRHTVTCESRLTPVPEAMPLPEAALLGCAIPTGAGMVLNTARLRPGSSIAIFGVGGIGLSAILAASLTNAATIIAIDRFDHRLHQAGQMGATHCIHSQRQDPLQTVIEITRGRGVDCAIEAAGNRETMEMAFRGVREKGGLCILAGNLANGEVMTLNPFDLIKGKQIIGTWGGESQPDRDIPLFVDLHISGRMDLKKMITHIYSLENINQALEDLEQGKVAGRALIDMGKNSTPEAGLEE